MKSCNVCKLIDKCYYCVKYGDQGIYIKLEKLLINNKQNIKKILDIHKLQLSKYSKS